jgi:HK97 family phage major capsid protein
MAQDTLDLALLEAKLKTQKEEIKGFVDKLEGEFTDKRKADTETKAAVEKFAAEIKETRDTIADLKQQLSKRATGGGQNEVKSIGAQVVENEAFTQWMNSNPTGGGANVPVLYDTKNVVSTSLMAGASTTGFPVPVPSVAMITNPGPITNIRQLIRSTPFNAQQASFIREKLFTNAAAPVAEGAAKPESALEWEQASLKVTKIAHWIKATKEVLKFVPQMRSIIDGRLLDGLREEENQQLITGDGTGENVNGLVTQATAWTVPVGASRLDSIYHAQVSLMLANRRATGLFLNPNDYAGILLLKDDDGQYYFGGPSQMNMNQPIWGLPVIWDANLTAGTAIVGDFSPNVVEIYDAETANVTAGFVNDDFTRNRITILAEEMLALAVYQPAAIRKFTLPV